MAEQTKRKKWSDVKARLEAFDRKGLVSLLGDLYEASVANRRFLHSRLTPGSRAIEEYRRLVADAIYPDPFSTRRVSVRDAAAAIAEYRRSTGEASGTVDLMLTFLEAGTEQAADSGERRRFWERTYPQGELHGGGPPALTHIPSDAATIKYRLQ